MRGRARQITFHVLDPKVVLDILDRDLVDAWREEDAVRAAENRKNAACKAKLRRQEKADEKPAEDDSDGSRFKLKGWADFERESGLG